MKRSGSYCVLLLVLAGLLGAGSLFAQSAAPKNPGTFIEATTNSVETLDPQFMLSTATMELSSNVYESLLTHPQGDMATLLPSLATTVPSIANKLIKVSTDGTTLITFPIRKGVKFQDGSTLTPEDVAYTFKRAILVGGQSTGIGILCRNLLGEDSFDDLVKKVGYDSAYATLDGIATAAGDSVTFRLPKPFVPFLGIMADHGMEAAIFNKAWCIAQGDWPGTKATGQKFMDMKTENDPLFKTMNGTGPFKLESADFAEQVVLSAFPAHWSGAPSISRVIRKIVPDNQTAILQLKAGDVDFVGVSVDDIGQLQGADGVKVYANLPSAWLMKINFVMSIADGSSYVGDGKLGPNGIPSNFFSDINVRKAFEYSFDWNTFIKDVFQGAALVPYGSVLIGFPTANPDNPKYAFDLDKARGYFKQAWGGQLWDKGFKMTAVYSSGSTHRQRALEILKDNIESLNPKFKIDLASLPWAGYVGAVQNKQLPLTLFGNLPTVFDPYQSLFENMDSAGGFADWGGYVDLAKQKFDPLVDIVASSYDNDKRKAASFELQRLYYENALAILYFQAVENVALRDWVKGYVPGAHPTDVDYSTISKK